MANSKNTIQNIPLTGQLCLNTLKTDVTQFEGYNEKNTTVFGGELTPLWKKKSEITSERESYTIYNSKGHSFTIKPRSPSDSRFCLWNNQTDKEVFGPYNNRNPGYLTSYDCPYTTKLELPSEAVWGGMFLLTKRELLEAYVDRAGLFYYRILAIGHEDGDSYPYWADKEIDKAINDVPWETKKLLTDVYSHTFKSYAITAKASYGELHLYILYTDLLREKLHLGAYLFRSNQEGGLDLFHQGNVIVPLDSNSHSFFGAQAPNPAILSVGANDTLYVAVTNQENGDISKVGVNEPLEFFKADFGQTGSEQWSSTILESDYFCPMTLYSGGSFSADTHFPKVSGVPGIEAETNSLNPYVAQKAFWFSTDIKNMTHFERVIPGQNQNYNNYFVTGHDGNGFIPGIMGTLPSDSASTVTYPYCFYLRDGHLTAITYGGIHISAPTSFSNNYVSTSLFQGSVAPCAGISYKSGNDWYFFAQLSLSGTRLFSRNTSQALKDGCVIDNRYILMLSSDSDKTFIFDIEKEQIVDVGSSLGYVNTGVPRGYDGATETTTCIYASGYNAGYTITGDSFIGFLENPTVMSYFPPELNGFAYSGGYRRGVQSYFGFGDTVQSAKYIGTDSEFMGTVYPIDPNGNVILPFALNNKIVNGFSNNDMIILNGVAYPMMYYNNNQKLYSYQLLAGIDGITGVFSLQGQRYLFDDNNIYTANFDNGVVSIVHPVCYKKSLVYLGSLPRAAIFYSFYNKTFYQFTGDAIVSKMFEANDINEIYSVAQNPATLSLWICSDQGVYVLSDNDMFKLEYNSHDVFFYKNKTNIVSADENGTTTSNIISFYKLEDGQTEQPIRLHTKYYGLGGELKATYDCWYIRLHNKDHKAGKLKLKVNTITNTSFETEEKTFDIEPSMYDGNDTIFIRYQPKYQSAVATQLELESDIAIYQISLGVNTTDAVAQQSKFNF